MFPRLRVFLFDAQRVFSSPVTILSPDLAMIYAGNAISNFVKLSG
jgi:hypothetical protein